MEFLNLPPPIYIQTNCATKRVVIKEVIFLGGGENKTVGLGWGCKGVVRCKRRGLIGYFKLPC